MNLIKSQWKRGQQHDQIYVKILVYGLIERTSSMLDEIESKTVHKDEGDQ